MFKFVFFYFCFQCPRVIVHAAYAIKPPKIIHHLVLLLLLLSLNKAFASVVIVIIVVLVLIWMCGLCNRMQQIDTLMSHIQTNTKRRLFLLKNTYKGVIAKCENIFQLKYSKIKTIDWRGETCFLILISH